MNRKRCGRVVGALATCGVLTACATYHPLPLATRPVLAPTVGSLVHPAGMGVTPLRIGDIALLAVINDPVLRAARARAGVAQAQVLQAGLLRNPQFSFDRAINLYTPGSTTVPWTIGIAQDVVSIITRPARVASARAHAASVQASLLWQEWQVIGKARLLGVDLIEGDRERDILERTQALLAGLYGRTAHALAAGNATLAQASPELVALTTVRTQIATLDRQTATWRHQLAALLGLVPDAPLLLADHIDLPPFDVVAVRQNLPDLAAHRPDLVALQFGYAAQEATVREAILAQFPALVIGVLGGEDNTRDYTVTPQVTLDVPVFDRNQGHVAIARATRRQLHAEYSARLAVANGEVEALLADIALLQRQIATTRSAQRVAVPVARAAEAAYRHGNLDARSYVDFVRTDLDLQLEVSQLRLALLERQVAIATLTGAGMPPIRPAPAVGARA